MRYYPIKSVYLAGPITGISYGEARHGWREKFAGLLPDHIVPYSPMRAKEYMIGQDVIEGEAATYKGGHSLATPSGVVTRDHNDVRSSDAMVACFLGAEKASQGTCIEFGWGHAYRKPIVMVAEPDNVHQHVMMVQIAGYVVDTLDEAAEIIKHILTPGV